MNNKILIGISGRMGSGKTTLSDALIKRLGGTKVSLAAPIKNLQNMIYNNVSIDMEGDKDRDLLIALGKWGRSKHEDFWLNEVKHLINTLDDIVIICDDIRFPNEAKFFKENGILMRINGEQRGINVDHNVNDATETALDNYPFDFYIDNRKSIEECVTDALMCIDLGVDDARESLTDH